MVLLFMFGSLHSQPPLFKSPVYIHHYAGEAVHQMVEFQIPASVILAQAIFESNCGTSELAKKSNNHFGIKCHREWHGDTMVKNDETLNECFRSYDNVQDSYTDHSLFLRSRARYAALFKHSVLDYKSWCYGLKACGYATYPLYAEELIRIIEENRLYEMDRAEKLERGLFCFSRPAEVTEATVLSRNKSIKQILNTEALFLDERHVLVQSLELLLNDEEPDVAGK
jgi:hypothetical protein